jgi:hypothetical protein
VKRCEVTAFGNKEDYTPLIRWHDKRAVDMADQCICLHNENMKVIAVNVFLVAEGGYGKQFHNL